MKKHLDIGERFGRLTVVAFHKSHKSLTFWTCQCDCGNEKVVSIRELLSGDTRSCGCLRREVSSKKNKTHGMTHTRIYKRWADMLTRCYNPDATVYAYYGGRGIRVCERWRSFENFYADMGEPPTAKHEIDRIDSNGNYTPENCRWVTRTQNVRNRKNTRFLTYHGVTRPRMEWAEIFGISYNVMSCRMQRGWSVEDILETPCWQRRAKTKNKA